MKIPKQSPRFLAAGLLVAGALSPLGLAGEPVAQKQVATQVISDPLVSHLESWVIQGLAKQAKLQSSFSRRRVTHEYTYQLVETTPQGNQDQRTFDVTRKSIPLAKSLQKKELEAIVYVKLRHLSSTNETQVALKEKWVPLSEHPILKRFQKPKKPSTIIP